ncbi:MAG: dihydroorotase [Firmicutes bacterium]|nr:dihydroorotase [Ezakiella sp.]MDD7761900.1 dihydroorotase [Bacillota bacterium]
MLLKNAHIMDPVTGLNEIMDVEIKGERISKIDKNLPDDNINYDLKGGVLAPSFFDPHTHFRDFGESEKETFETGALAALRGGYTKAVAMANTIPPIDSVEMVRAAKEKVFDLPIDIIISSNLTKKMEGKELVDVDSIVKEGINSFTDDGKPITDSEIMIEALKKSKEYDFIISLHEEDPSFIDHAGYNSTAPREAEASIIKRDIDLLKKYGGNIHIQHLSSKEGVDIIKQAKHDGLNITCEVTPNHLFFTEDDVEKYGTLLKINPPIRTNEDRLALIEGLKDGTIDMIATDHAPHTSENKKMGKYESKSGIISLEISFSMLVMKLLDEGHLDLMQIIKILSSNPRKLYKSTSPIAVGEYADFVYLCPDLKYNYIQSFSKSKNTPLLGEELKGSILFTMRRGVIEYSDIKYFTI